MQRNWILPAAVALLALAAAPARAQGAEPRILVSGTVVDSVSGYPLYGVAVGTSTTADRTASDSSGAFTLAVPAGTVLVTFTGRGFERAGQVVTSTADVELGRVALVPQAVALAPIEASVSLLEQRARAYTGTLLVFDPGWLERSGERDMLDFVMHRASLHPSPCNMLDTGPMNECFLVRGFPKRPMLFVNETQVGHLSQLRVYRPEEVARVEIFAGGAMVRVYTRVYLEQMARTNPRPDPLPPT